MTKQQSSSGVAIARGVIKALAITIGLAGTLVSLMALVGAVFESGWVRFPVAAILAIVVPAVLTDRLLPDDDPARGKGLPGDVFALTWLVVPVVMAVALHGPSSKLLTREGDRLARAGVGPLASVAYLLAGVRAEPGEVPEPETLPAGSASASAGPAGSSTPPPSGVPAPSAEPPNAGAAPPKPKKPDDPELSPSELFKRLAPAVVTVSVKVAEGFEGGGTGFLIDDEGTIVTNHHVISDAKALSIRFMNGATYEEMDLLAEDSGQDLALLQVELKKPKEGESPEVLPVELGDSEDVTVGERAIAIGNPLGLEHTLTDGLISARRVFKGKQWIQMSVPISPGNSGGPLFNMRGRAIGVTTAKVGGIFGENLNLAVPVNALKQLIKPEYPGRRKFGKGPASSHW
jgi:serine protease Do